MRNSTRIIVWCSCALVTACATPGPTIVDSVTPIAAGLEQAKQQTEVTFTTTNQMARDLDVARVLQNDPPSLAENDFPVAIAVGDRQNWATAFSVLEAYTRDLQNLVDPSRAAATKSNLNDLASQLNDGATKANLPGPAVAAFTELASVLVQLHEERTAQEIMQRTDPAFAQVMQAMADAVGATDATGLRSTTHIYWQSKLADIRTEYAAARAAEIKQKRADSSQREALISQFVKAMDDRDAQMASLEGLRGSLLALAQAHHAAAYGNRGDALFWIQRISTWLDEAKTSSATSTPSSGESK